MRWPLDGATLPGVMFHVQLRQFPHLARAFNLTAEELHSRVLDLGRRVGTFSCRTAAGIRSAPA